MSSPAATQPPVMSVNAAPQAGEHAANPRGRRTFDRAAVERMQREAGLKPNARPPLSKLLPLEPATEAERVATWDKVLP